MDVEMRRTLDAPTVLGIDKFALKTGSSASEVPNLRRSPARESVAFRHRLWCRRSVKKVVSSTPALVKIIVGRGAQCHARKARCGY